jgi:hypothetical protein
MSQEIRPDRTAPGAGQLPLFRPAVHTELTHRRDGGGPLTDTDFAALERLLAAYRLAGTSAPAGEGAR